MKEHYFARVAPLLGRGLMDHRVRISGADHLAELLASCRLRSFPSASPALQALLAWRNEFETFDFSESDANFTVLGAPGHEARATWYDRRVECSVPSDPLLARFMLNAVARELRDSLMQRAPFPTGTRHYGNARWPFACGVGASFQHDLSNKHVAIIGAGSIGSELARLLDTLGARLSLIDAAAVSVFNPQRQWFSTREIGQPKVAVLASRLRRANALQLEANEAVLEALLASDRPDYVVLATGTHHRHQIPHIATCAYPQARFFEALIAIPTRQTPCYDCYRGHLHRGVQAPPVPADDVSSFLYIEPDQGKRDQTYKDLVAEPATAIETSRVADVATACLIGLTQGAAWMERAIQEHTLCLIGGNTTVTLAGGDPAYGITHAGQVVRVGLEDLIGDTHTCATCGRELKPTHKVTREQVSAAIEDAALLA
jgi:hypothetical protein